MSHYYSIPLVNDAELAQARAVLGTGLARILGYFREDGSKSIVEIEQALAQDNPAAMVLPAHTLKGESRQFGAHRLGDIAEAIEMTARRCLEQHSTPQEVAAEVAMLRGCFVETLAALQPAVPSPQPHGTQPHGAQPHAASPAGHRPATFGNAPRTFGRRTG